MSQYPEYIGLLPEEKGSPVVIANCITDDQAKEVAAQFLSDNPDRDEVALYRIVQVGRRETAVKWS